jgi:endonuclease YncB( thermonuclease family)
MTRAPAHAETMRAPLLLAAFALLLAGSCSSHGVSLTVQSPATLNREPPGYESARVTRVVDGDTIEVVITGRRAGPGAGDVRQGQHHDVRLLGIDTPESVNPNSAVECFGEESSAALAAFLEDREVVLVDDVENTDQYDRLLRYVYLGHERRTRAWWPTATLSHTPTLPTCATRVSSYGCSARHVETSEGSGRGLRATGKPDPARVISARLRVDPEKARRTLGPRNTG